MDRLTTQRRELEMGTELQLLRMDTFDAANQESGTQG